MGPSGCHLRNTLLAKFEVMSFLIILDFSCRKNRMPLCGVILELAGGCSFKISWIYPQLIVSSYLVQCILIAKELILAEICLILFVLETLDLFGAEILTPTSGVVPMR